MVSDFGLSGKFGLMPAFNISTSLYLLHEFGHKLWFKQKIKSSRVGITTPLVLVSVVMVVVVVVVVRE